MLRAEDRILIRDTLRGRPVVVDPFVKHRRCVPRIDPLLFVFLVFLGLAARLATAQGQAPDDPDQRFRRRLEALQQLAESFADRGSSEDSLRMTRLLDQFARAREEPAAAQQALLASRELASRRELDPEVRLELSAVVRDAAWLSGYDELQGNAAIFEAELRRELGDEAGASAVLEEALLRLPRARMVRPALLIHRAELQRSTGQSAAALQTLDELEEAVHGAAEPAWLAATREAGALRGRILLEFGNPDEARPLLGEALATAERLRAEGLSASRFIAAARGHAVDLLLALEQQQSAAEQVDAFLADHELYALVPHERARLLGMKGIALSELERTDRARPPLAGEVLFAALEEPELLPSARLPTLLALAEWELRQGHREAAAGRLTQARELVSPGGAGASAAASLTMLQARLVLAERPRRDELESLEARLLADLARLHSAFEQAPRRPAGLGFLRYAARRGIVSELIEVTLQRHGPSGPAEALGHLLTLEEQSTLARRLAERSARPSAAGSVSELQTHLTAREGLVVYFPGPVRSHAFAVDSHQVVHVQLAPRDHLHELAERWNAQLVQPPATRSAEALARHPGEEREHALRLALELVPRELWDWLDLHDHATIVGLDRISPIAFAALPTPRAVFAGTEYALDEWPSLAVGLQLLRRSPPGRSNQDLVVLAAPIPGDTVHQRWPDLARLPWTAEDGDPLTRWYATDRRQIFAGAEATVQRLESALVGSPVVFQFLGHAVLDDTRTQPLALVCSAQGDDPGLLYCPDVEELPATRFVLLTGCLSTLGPVRRGEEGAEHMGGAWLLAGADAVLVAGAELAWTPTLLLSASLHRQLARRGASPAEALREARRHLLAAHPELADPFYHATLRIIGRGQQTLFPARHRLTDPGTFVRIFAACLAGALVLAWILRRRFR